MTTETPRFESSFGGFAESVGYKSVTHGFVGRTLKPFQGMKVGDLCCGTGLATRKIVDMLSRQEATVIGIDNNPVSLGQARLEIPNVGNTEVRFEEADARNLPIDAKFFDTIYMLNALHEIQKRADKLKILREILRTLKPGKKVCINTTFTQESNNPAPRIWGNLKLYSIQEVGGTRDRSIHGFETLKTADYEELLREAGFVNIQVAGNTGNLSPRDMDEISKYAPFIEGVFLDVRKDGKEISLEEGSKALMTAIKRMVKEHEEKHRKDAKPIELIFPRNWIEFEAEKPEA